MFVAVGTCISCGIGTYPNWTFFCGFVGMFMFFCAHWQTYVSGTLRFGLWVHLRLIRLNLLKLSVWGVFFNCIVFPNVFCRVDVTEVQIAIVIMYLMTAFGGVSLWETRVRHSPSLASHWASEVSLSFTTFINSHYNHWSGLHWKSPLWPITKCVQMMVCFWLYAEILFKLQVSYCVNWLLFYLLYI